MLIEIQLNATCLTQNKSRSRAAADGVRAQYPGYGGQVSPSGISCVRATVTSDNLKNYSHS